MFLILVAAVLIPVSAIAQEAGTSEWQFIPSVVLVGHMPSGRIEVAPSYAPPIAWWGSDGTNPQYSYSGTGLDFHVRAFNKATSPLVFTVGAGINWFSPTRQDYPYVLPAERNTNGIGEILLQHRQDFMTFPLSLGVEVAFPESKTHSLFVFAGGSAMVTFINGDLDIGQQTKAGYSVGGGFVVQFMEFGLRYYSFSDIRTIAPQLGLRLPAFGIN